MDNVDNTLQLRNLSKTRWTARAESIKAVWVSYEAICNTLQYICSHPEIFDRNTRTKAFSINKKMHSFDFIVSLVFMKNIMYKLKSLTETLETKSLCVIDAAVLIEATIKNLEDINSDSERINDLIDSATLFAANLGIDSESDFKVHHRSRKQPTWLDPNVGTEADITFHVFYKKEFKCILSTLINLSKDNLKVFIDTIMPLYKISSFSFKNENMSIENIKNALLIFHNSDFAKCKDIEAIQAELEILKEICKDLSLTMTTNFLSIIEKCEEVKHILPLANNICRLALTAPVSVATNERTFSKLKLIKNHLRSTMTDNRLDSLMLLSIEKDILDTVDFLSDTRWACHSEACRALTINYKTILTVFFEISDSKNENGDTKYDAKVLLKKMLKKETGYLCLFWNEILQHCNKVSIDLQSKSNDILKAVNLLKSLKNVVSSLRNSNMVYECRVGKFCSQISIIYKGENKRKIIKKFSDGNNKTSNALSGIDKCRVETHHVIVYKFCSELDKRINAYSVVVENFLFLTRLHVESTIDVEESVNKFISVYKDDVDDSIKYGIENEPIAKICLEIKLGVNIQPCGLFVHRKLTFMAASPDGLIDNDGIVEIKCPASIKDMIPEATFENKNLNFMSLKDGILKLKTTHSYYFQVQGQLEI
ncbi:hypothetical protein QTP88_006804 [Uroleucon formosanum]